MVSRQRRIAIPEKYTANAIATQGIDFSGVPDMMSPEENASAAAIPASVVDSRLTTGAAAEVLTESVRTHGSDSDSNSPQIMANLLKRNDVHRPTIW